MTRSGSPRSTLIGAFAGAAATLVGLPVVAQPTVEELTVTGRYGRVPDSVRSLSQAVSYADLDLSTDGGKRELRRRINLTARYLCEKLGETDTTSSVVPPCRQAAVKDAMGRLGTLEANFAPRGTTWTAGRAWEPPYPADWAATYR